MPSKGQPEGQRVVRCGGMDLEVAPEFKYSGSKITANGEVYWEIATRIASGKKFDGGLRKVLSSRNISR